MEGGAATVVDGLLDAGCTVLVPTFSSAFSVAPPPHLRPARNGWDYTRPALGLLGEGRSYTPDTNELDPAMGAIPAAVLARPDRVRGEHPLNSFTAAGPHAHDLIDRQRPDHVYAPLERLAALDGAVVLMGVGLTSMTLLHLAEQQAGRTLFRRWANDRHGEAAMVECGSCSTGFNSFDPVLAPYERRTEVGSSVWRIYPAAPVLADATRAIRADPTMTHCGRAECRCSDAVLGGPILSGVETQGR